MIKSICVVGAALWVAFSAAAAPPVNSDLEEKYFAGLRCREQVFAQLTTIKATREWSQPSAREMDGSRRFHSPTQVLGVWVEARIFMNGEALLRRITDNYIETRTFDLTTCKLKQAVQKNRPMFDGSDHARFTDRDLRELIARHGKGLIYIWSPNMPYSYQQRLKGQSGIEVVREVGRKLGLKVTILVDPAARPGLAKQVASQYSHISSSSLRSAQSMELALRSARTHYPALIVYADGRVSRHVYPGLGTVEEYSKYLRGELHDLQN